MGYGNKLWNIPGCCYWLRSPAQYDALRMAAECCPSSKRVSKNKTGYSILSFVLVFAMQEICYIHFFWPPIKRTSWRTFEWVQVNYSNDSRYVNRSFQSRKAKALNQSNWNSNHEPCEWSPSLDLEQSDFFN